MNVWKMPFTYLDTDHSRAAIFGKMASDIYVLFYFYNSLLERLKTKMNTNFKSIIHNFFLELK